MSVMSLILWSHQTFVHLRGLFSIFQSKIRPSECSPVVIMVLSVQTAIIESSQNHLEITLCIAKWKIDGKLLLEFFRSG